MTEELLPKPQVDLPKPLTDLPLPRPPATEAAGNVGQAEKEIPAHLASKGLAFRSYGKFLALGIVFIVLLGIIGGAYFLGRNSVFKELNPTAPVIPPKDPVIYEGTPTPDPTANWETISTGNFSIKIPDNWFTESTTDNYIRVQNYNPVGAPGRGFDPVQDKGWFAIQIGKLDKKANNIEQLKTVLGELDTESKSAGFSIDPTTDSEVDINGASGIKRISIKLPQEPPVVYLLDGKGGVFFFTPSLDLSVERDNFEKILSTFTFIESKLNQ